MNRSSLLFAVIVVLALAGSAFAQSTPGDVDPSGTANTQPATTTPAVQGDSPDPQPESPPAGDVTDTPTSQPHAAQPPAAEKTPASLPATAGENPLMFAVGALSLGAFVTLLLYRKSWTTRS